MKEKLKLDIPEASGPSQSRWITVIRTSMFLQSQKNIQVDK